MTQAFLDGRARLQGRVAVVVGGGGGIGRAVSLGLAGAGVNLAICDIDGTALAATAAEARELGVAVLAMETDATVTAALASFYDEVGRTFDGIDILVNVVGGVKRGRFMDSTPEAWQADIHRNYVYVLESIHRVVPSMIRRGGGSIVNFTTIEAHRGAATFAVYAGAKAALTNFTRSLAVELGSQNIRINTLASDSTPTAGNMNAISAELREEAMAATPEQHLGGRRMYIPMGRAASVDDLANGVLFLVSDLAASITGTTLHIDAGTHAASGFIDWPNGVGHLPAPLGKPLSRLFPSADA
ncbi:NAD(P)-dependent dehydrogenase, short-chain alcohol dehydrogenase family [Sphingomonas sp. YR710]|uniref:SDR family NAD(P)-dependent oxidoreductase n=1 Tax=Sphingomonas sp. YR710 TaxID=1882773 RepID=UPI00088721C8|nr:SDR family oxidoreductase [Sphingomonas sp. YR710]SDD47935.1 NAD(P)-dependent dehydrogenase, short-chain alcohol dehydrogenase family [Sphingomonas sp. YR710]